MKTLKHGEQFSNATFFDSIRFWLIHFIAGNDVIILNAKIEIKDREREDQAFVCLSNVKDCLFDKCKISVQDKILHISQLVK